jgi:HEAT repeat protein
MTPSKLRKMSVDELIAQFARIGEEQYAVISDENHTKYNRLYRQLADVRDELQSRPGDQRRSLIRLFDHPNPQVRLMAASMILELEPEAARPVLQAIHDSREPYLALNAGMSLSLYDLGYRGSH